MSNIQLFLGDSFEFLRLLKRGSVDVVISDPPYPNRGAIMAEDLEKAKSVLKLLNQFAPRLIIFWDSIDIPLLDYLISAPVIARHVWHKTNGWQAGNWELITEYDKSPQAEIYNGKVYSYRGVGEYKTEEERRLLLTHPTTKPVKLMRQIVEDLTTPGQVVLDCFMGLGSTGIACKELGRGFIGVEKRPEYFEIAKKRIAEANPPLPGLEGLSRAQQQTLF